VSKRLTKYSGLLSSLSEVSTGSEEEIPLPNVSSREMSRVLQFLEYYDKIPMTPLPPKLTSKKLSDHVQEWYVDFISEGTASLEFQTSEETKEETKGEERKEESMKQVWDNGCQHRWGDLYLAANYLSIEPLLRLCSAFMATKFVDQTLEEVSSNFGINPPLSISEEEEDTLRKTYPWIDE